MSQKITLFFNYEGSTISIQCYENDRINDIFIKACTKLGLELRDTKFYYNSKEVRVCEKTLFDLGVGDRGNFNVVYSKYVLGA